MAAVIGYKDIESEVPGKVWTQTYNQIVVTKGIRIPLLSEVLCNGTTFRIRALANH